MAVSSTQNERERSVDLSNTHKTNMFLAQRLNRQVKRFFADWEENNIDMTDLREAISFWFLNSELRTAFLNVLDLAEKYPNGMPQKMRGRIILVPVSPLTSGIFRRELRKHLFNDFSQRFQNMGEVLSMLAWLVGEDKITTTQEIGQMTDVLGLGL
jgi:hypothetical protein